MRKITLAEWCERNNRQDILAEWDVENNKQLDETPYTIASRSSTKVWWICGTCNNRWKTAVTTRVNGCGCPVCGHKECDRKRRQVSFEDSLANTHPELLAEWDYCKNKDIDPKQISHGSSLKVGWICKKCGKSWEATVANRVYGKGCPYCAHIKVNTGVDDLQSLFPEIAAEYDDLKNTIPVAEVFAKANYKVWWKCPKGHSYYARVADRTNSNHGCPYCSGRIAITGTNDLKTVYPDLAKEWDYEKNKPLLPEEILPSSGRKIWWKCEKGHSWQAPPYNRIKGVGCPTCNGFIQTSLPEQAIQFYLAPHFNLVSRSKIQGVEVDIFLPDYNIGIEYDGIYYHSSEKSRQKEEKKNKLLQETGVTLIRIKEDSERDAVENNTIYYRLKPNYSALDNVIKTLVTMLERITHVNCSEDIDFNRDRLKILALYKQYVLKNSFAVANPSLLAEWDYNKNSNISPESFSPRSNQKVWWLCPEGHSYMASIQNRTNGTGCPVCNNKQLLTGYNDIVAKNPALASEWDYSKNGITPDKVICSSPKKYWWKCSACGLEWETAPCNRERGSGCPRCAQKRVGAKNQIPKENEITLEVAFPEIAAQWDKQKNVGLSPNQVLPYSNKKRWWICPRGHSYEMRVITRTSNGCNCPYCSGQKVLKGYNDLSTLRPDIVKEWDYTKNVFLPDEVSTGSTRKAWWVCPRCGNHYNTTIQNRTKKQGSGCPICGRERTANSRKRAVKNVETGEVFNGIVDAARKYNKSHTTLSACLAGKSHTAYGYHWEYYQEEKN